MNTLILSCNTGQGHNSCAAAIKEYYDHLGQPCAVEDALAFISEGISAFISWGHSTVYRHLPWLFRLGYRWTEQNPAVLRAHSPVYKLLTKGTGKLYSYLCDHSIDAVICAHPFAALMMTELFKQHPGCVASANLATDYVCHPGVHDTALDLYFIPDAALAPSFESPGIRPEQIIPSGLPVRQMFYTARPMPDAKHLMGVPEERKHLVMMCGSMGCGPMKRLSRQITRQMGPEVTLSIVCGTNHRLHRHLTRRYRADRRVQVLGYVEDMSALMDSAEVCLTKPGGISTTEAAVKALPMVLINAVSGCERYNLSYFTALGGAKTGAGVKALARTALELLNSPEEQRKMRASLAPMGERNAAEIIYTRMKELVEQRENENPASCC